MISLLLLRKCSKLINRLIIPTNHNFARKHDCIFTITLLICTWYVTNDARGVWSLFETYEQAGLLAQIKLMNLILTTIVIIRMRTNAVVGEKSRGT